MTAPVPAQRLEGRLALITGASRGIGRAVAERFAAEGADLILLGRTVGALEEVDDVVRGHGRSATLVPLDLMDADGLDKLGLAIHERWGKLDIVVGNAALLGPLTPLAHLDPKDWSKLVQTNLTANLRLIRALDPLLRQSDAGRVIFVTSGVARSPRPFWGPYAVTKAALETAALTYAAECESTDIRVNLINPGATRTAMRARAMPGENPDTLPPAEDLAPLFVDYAHPDCTANGTIVTFRDTDYFTAQNAPSA